jgi:hypothetical protein
VLVASEKPMPTETHRVHLPWDDPRCDTLEILNMAARQGRRYVDCNTCVSADDTAWNLHWAEGPRLNHYDWIWTGKRRWGREVRRPMTDAELRRNVHEWSDDEIRRWRRARHGGRKPATVRQRQRQAKRRSVIICWELKSRAFAEADVAERIAEDVRASGWPAYFMALVTMRLWGQKARAIHQAGGQFALLAHGEPKPSAFDTWKPYITEVWGRFR